VKKLSFTGSLWLFSKEVAMPGCKLSLMLSVLHCAPGRHSSRLTARMASPWDATEGSLQLLTALAQASWHWEGGKSWWLDYWMEVGLKVEDWKCYSRLLLCSWASRYFLLLEDTNIPSLQQFQCKRLLNVKPEL
jgi:hypothetical protein